MQVRKLKAIDVFRVAKILSKMSKSAIQELKEETNELQMSYIFMTSALEQAENELLSFFADLVEMETEEFEELGVDAPIDVIEQLAEKEDLKNFLQRVRALMKKFKGN
jgi:hypothetical protein